MRKVLLILGIMAASIFYTTVFASVSDDQVTSQKIREADGTSGQNTNSGSGVKTGHIQNGAVTTTKVADGAVTDSKIGGTISQSKVTGLEAALAGKSDVTHNHDTLYQHKYGKVAVVAKTGGDYWNLNSAMDDLAVWCGQPSENSPCLLKIMPGSYPLSYILRMAPYVDIEGSGENTTIISGYTSQGVIGGASNAELRNLTVKSVGISIASGISNYAASPKITNVSVIVGATNVATGIANQYSSPIMTHVTIDVSNVNSIGSSVGITNAESSSPVINDVTINIASSGRGYGFSLGNACSIKMTNSSITHTGTAYSASCGITNSSDSASTVTIDNSAVKNFQNAICNVGTMYIGHSKIDGPISNSGTIKCFSVFDGNYDAVTCQ